MQTKVIDMDRMSREEIIETVSKGLKQHGTPGGTELCKECPYKWAPHCVEGLCSDALAVIELLKGELAECRGG